MYYNGRGFVRRALQREREREMERLGCDQYTLLFAIDLAVHVL